MTPLKVKHDLIFQQSMNYKYNGDHIIQDSTVWVRDDSGEVQPYARHSRVYFLDERGTQNSESKKTIYEDTGSCLQLRFE